jgi:hypothetical protein
MILPSGVRFTSGHPRLMEAAIASVPTSTALTSGGQGNGRVAISKLSSTDTCNMKAVLAARALAARTAAAPRSANQTASQIDLAPGDRLGTTTDLTYGYRRIQACQRSLTRTSRVHTRDRNADSNAPCPTVVRQRSLTREHAQNRRCGHRCWLLLISGLGVRFPRGARLS